MKILIIKTSALGDIIQAFPVLEYLKYHYPQAQIDWVVERPFIELIRAHPLICQVHAIQTRQWRTHFWQRKTYQEIRQFCHQLRKISYNIVFDLQGNIKSGLLTAITNSPIKVGFGFTSVHEWPNLFFTNQRYNPPAQRNIREDYLFLAQSLVGDFKTDAPGVQLRLSSREQEKIDQILSNPILQGGPMIMVCPGSNWSNKQLSEESLRSFLQQVQDYLQARFLFVWGTQGEKQIAERMRNSFSLYSLIIDKLDLPVLQNLMAHVQLVVAMDSLPLHLAGTTMTPTYSIFGASLAHKYKPMGRQHQSFQGHCPYNKQFAKRCPILRTCSTGNCIKDIQGMTLFNHFVQWWQSQVMSHINITY